MFGSYIPLFGKYLFQLLFGGSYSNCYTSGTIYGVLMVLTNDGTKWRKTDSSSWLWQIIITTGGNIWMRRGVNGTAPEGWSQYH